MRKLIAAFNMTLDGFCDHAALSGDDEILRHYCEILANADTILYGRITYRLMEDYWPSVVRNPTGNKAADEFAVLLDYISKIVFSRTVKEVEWKNARLAEKDIREEVLELRRQPGRDILAGSRSIIVELMNLGLVDEYQLSVQPIVLGKGMALFQNISHRMDLRLVKTKTFGNGTLTLYYVPKRKHR